jgi:hypothetical protein
VYEQSTVLADVVDVGHSRVLVWYGAQRTV